MTFKDKFTNRFNPFDLKKKKKMTEMVEAWGWAHFSGVYLRVFLLFLMVLRRCRRFKSTFVSTKAWSCWIKPQRSKMFPNLSERHCIITRDCLCSHATVIQSELVEIHMHAFQKRRGRGGEEEEEEEEEEDERRAGSFI